jgi:2-phosphosulfolactate phosphatase
MTDESGPALHVLFRKEDLDPERIAGKTLVVVDILFATTSIVTALDRGVDAVYPALDADEALALSRSPGIHAPVLSGEAMFQFIDGFAPPTPLALAPHLDGHDCLIYTTTNGTVALRAGAGAERVLVGALVNAGATARTVEAGNPGTVIIVCAGTAGAFNMEDFYGAGCLVDRIARRGDGYRLTDAAMAARDYFRGTDAAPVLHGSMVGRLMQEWGLAGEVDFAARIDALPFAAELRGDRVARV